MRILPVLDVQNGIVVRGIRGLRTEYRAIHSILCDSSRPLDVARAFRRHFGFDDVYLADLDAIAGGLPSTDLYRRLSADGFRLWIDPGVANRADASMLFRNTTVHRIVVGLETMESPQELRAILSDCGSERVVFSLDLKDGRPLARWRPWTQLSPVDVLELSLLLGVRQILLLDLSRVGSGEGVGTELLVRAAKRSSHAPTVYVGGGVRGPDDLQSLDSLGVDGVLVASVLHDGRVRPDDLHWNRPTSEIY